MKNITHDAIKAFFENLKFIFFLVYSIIKNIKVKKMPMIYPIVFRQPTVSFITKAVPKKSVNPKGFKKLINNVMNIFRKPSSLKMNVKLSSKKGKVMEFPTHLEDCNYFIEKGNATTLTLTGCKKNLRDIDRAFNNTIKNNEYSENLSDVEQCTIQDDFYELIERCYKKPDLLPPLSAEDIFNEIYTKERRDNDLEKCISGARENTRLKSKTLGLVP